MSETDYKFEGWAAMGKDSIKGNLKFIDYSDKIKPFCDDDVDIKIYYAGICASDLHTMSGGWGDVPYPQVVGHEIVGKVLRVGSEVKHLKVGDWAGVGAQSDSCLECDECKAHLEPHCAAGQTGTYAGEYKRQEKSKGYQSFGGYSNNWRGPSHFTFKIPDGLDPAAAAPLLCGGVTTYSPLVQHGAGKEAKDVGIIGIGGLGHFGLLFAKALGANVTAISHSESKKEDAEKMGASRFIATHSGKEDDFAPYKRSLDLIICTTNDTEMPILGYLSLLRPHGKLVLVGAPEKPLPELPAFPFIMNGVFLGGSAIGSPKTIREMLDFAAEKQIKPWIVKRPLEDVNQAVVDMHASKARYRYVLVNQKNGGEL
ncbi:NAD(P)-dependent alcohol dehydrogenase [Sporobolomyces koalae]|uniref:NAD(P)-dependent alcohol dehydrogenase n=1 Tax=Sporobolomyces koalae TaxID=500713 RepID=UPI003177C144